MRSIDIHAHISPQPFIDAIETGENWHGITSEAVASHHHNPRTVWSPEARLADMDSLGVDVQVLSTNAVFYYYDKDAEAVAATCSKAHTAQLTYGETYDWVIIDEAGRASPITFLRPAA